MSMRKKCIAWGGGIALAVLMCITGCKNPYNESQKSNPRQEYVPIVERVEEKTLSSKTSKSVFHLVRTVESAVQAVDQYVDVPDTAQSLTGMSLEDIGEYLPADISTEYDTVSYPLFAKTDWDFDSIMLYPNFRIKPPYDNTRNGFNEVGFYQTKKNVKISQKDIELIKWLY